MSYAEMTHTRECRTKAGKWELQEEEIKLIDRSFYERATDQETIIWFQNIGGKESITKDQFGRVTKTVSVSPDGLEKSTRQFNHSIKG
jgi:hypothetical protein